MVRVQVVMDLDGGKRADVTTGIPFLDRLLKECVQRAQIDLGLRADGDLAIDDLHTVREVGAALGEAVQSALEGSPAINLKGSAFGVSGDALVLVVLEIGEFGQAYGDFPDGPEKLGGLTLAYFSEFLRAFCQEGNVTAHVHVQAGTLSHLRMEAAFKALGDALGQAVKRKE